MADALEDYVRNAIRLQSLARYGEALTNVDLAISQKPEHPGLAAMKVSLLRQCERRDEAVQCAIDAMSRGLNSPQMKHAFAQALQACGCHDEAIPMFELAARQSETPAVVLSDMGVCYTEMGAFEAAENTFARALALKPDFAEGWYNLVNLITVGPGWVGIEAMEKLIASGVPWRSAMALAFALGKAHYESGNTERAFHFWHKGNAMKRETLSYDVQDAIGHIRYWGTRPLMSTPLVPTEQLSEKPVFIVGFPRSGSSLLEQMLACHPDVYAAGETLGHRAWFRAVAQGNRRAGTAAVILDRFESVAPRALRVVDKDLENFRFCGIIHEIFPKARILWARRDPVDACFSAYTKLFGGEIHYSYDLEECGTYYRAMHELMTHWQTALPEGALMAVDYERLLGDPPGMMRRVLGFLGLPWDPRVLRHWEAPRPVATSSFVQVRRPLYTTSIGAGRKVDDYLGPLIRALGPLA